jgi:hypothetical protein
MRPPESRPTDDVELLIDRYATERLAPDPDQIAKGRAAMLAALAGTGAMPAPTRRRRHSLLRGWSLAAAFALLLVTVGSLVAAESGPGQPFYGLRLAIGSVNLPVGEPAHDRGLAAQLDDRLTEVGAAAEIGDGRGVRAAIHEYLRTLSELTRNGVSDPAILALLQRHQDTLQQLLSVAPTQATDGVQEALDAAGNVSSVIPPTESAVPHPTPPQAAGESAPAAGKP